MKVHFSKKYLRQNLFFGLLWVLYVASAYYIKKEYSWFDYFFIIGALFYLTTYFLGKEKGYLQIENGVLKKNTPFSKSIALKDIRQVKYFAGDYQLITEHKEITLNTQIMASESFEKLKAILEPLPNDAQDAVSHS